MSHSLQLEQITPPRQARIATTHSYHGEEGLLNAENVSAPEDIPPNGGYGWVCTFCLFLINFHTWGITSAWGVILAHFIAEGTYPDATHLDYAFIGGLSISLCLLVGPLVSKTHRTFGTFLTLLVGAGFVFAALIGASYATQIWHLYLTQGVTFGVGMGFLYLTATAVVPRWFSTRRSFSMGLASSGSGLGGIAYNLAAARAIQTLGVASTYRVLSFCALASNLVASALLKDRPKTHTQANANTTPQRTLNRRDLSRFEIWLMVLWGITTEFGYITLYYSLPSYASSIGLSPQQGSVANAVLNVGLVIGRPCVGYISDTYGRITVSMMMTGVCGLICFAFWIPATSYALLLLFAILAGTVCGTFWCTITPVTAEVVGLNRLPATFTLICLILVVPTTVAEPIALSLVGGSGSEGYLGTQLFIAFMFTLGAMALWVLRSWKFYEIERKAFGERRGEESVGGVGALAAFPNYFAWVRPQKLFLRGRV